MVLKAILYEYNKKIGQQVLNFIVGLHDLQIVALLQQVR